MASSRNTELFRTLDRFNQGCTFFSKAMGAWAKGDLATYETSLRKSATEAIGSLEWSIKVYLKSVRDKLSRDEQHTLKRATFADLITIFQLHAHPSLSADDVSAFYEYRDQYRNPAEHQGSVPFSTELRNALIKIREFIIGYLRPEGLDVKLPVELPAGNLLHDQRRRYFDTLIARYEFMDLGGISPRVGSKIVKIKMADVFIPLNAVEGELTSDIPFDQEESKVAELQEEIATGKLGRALKPISYSSLLESKKCVVLGDPGSGKTTLGRFIAFCIATQRKSSIPDVLLGMVPIVIRASEFAASLSQEPGLVFFDYIERIHTTQFGELFENVLRTGQALVIIDGLDEIAEPECRTVATRRIEQFVTEFQNNRFLITSRIVGYTKNQLSAAFSHARLADLTQDQVLSFLVNWNKAIEAETSKSVSNEEVNQRALDLSRAIAESAGIRKLAGNPLLLTIIALANFRGTKLPSRRVELYQIATETLIENWPLKQRGLHLDSTEIQAILEPIAYRIFSAGRINQITEFDLRPLFEAQVCELRGTPQAEAKSISRELLNTIEQHTGFFIERGRNQSGQKLYGFLHQTFGEYLTGRHLATRWSAGELDLAEFLHDSKWHEVLLLMAGEIGTWNAVEATKFVSSILESNSPYESILHRDLFFAAEVLADNVRVKRDLQDRIAGKLVQLALGASHNELSERARYLLHRVAAFSPIGTIKEAITFLPSDSPYISSRKALLSLALGDADPVAMRKILTSQELNFDVTFEAFRLLSLNPKESADAYLLGIEPSGEDYVFTFEVSPNVAKVALSCGHPIHGLDDLVAPPTSEFEIRIWLIPRVQFKEMKQSYLRTLAVAAWPMKTLLLDLPLTDDLEEIIQQGIEKLSNSNDLTEIEQLAEGLDLLLSFGNSEAADFEKLNHFDKVFQRLVKLSSASTESKVRVASLRFIVNWIGSPEVGKAIAKASSDPSKAVRVQIARLAQNIGNPGIEVMLRLLSDPEADVRQAAALSIARMSAELPTSVIETVAEQLGSIEYSETADWRIVSATDALISLLAIEGDSGVRGRILKILLSGGERLRKERYLHVFAFGRRKNVVLKPDEIAQLETIVRSKSTNRRIALSIWDLARKDGENCSLLLSVLDGSNDDLSDFAFRLVRPSDLNHEAVVASVFRFMEAHPDLPTNHLTPALSNDALKSKIINICLEILQRDTANSGAFNLMFSGFSADDSTIPF